MSLRYVTSFLLVVLPLFLQLGCDSGPPGATGGSINGTWHRIGNTGIVVQISNTSYTRFTFINFIPCWDEIDYTLLHVSGNTYNRVSSSGSTVELTIVRNGDTLIITESDGSGDAYEPSDQNESDFVPLC